MLASKIVCNYKKGLSLKNTFAIHYAILLAIVAFININQTLCCITPEDIILPIGEGGALLYKSQQIAQNMKNDYLGRFW